MAERTSIGDLQIEKVLYDLVANEIAPGTGIDADSFWDSVEDILKEFMPINAALLENREQLQLQIDDWHRQQTGKPHDSREYERFLRDIGYLMEEGDSFEIETENVDEERNIEITLAPWILLTEDKVMTIPKEWVITIVNPIDSIAKMYQEKIDG